MHYELINKATRVDRPDHCRDNPHEVERMKVQVREMSLSRFAEIAPPKQSVALVCDPRVYRVRH